MIKDRTQSSKGKAMQVISIGNNEHLPVVTEFFPHA
jgi:hypothetical protein